MAATNALAWRRALGLLGCTLAAAAGAAGPGAAAAEAPFVPAAATPAEVRAATRLEPYLAGLSRSEPPLCAGVEQVRREMAGAASAGGGFSLSPASTEVEELEPNRTYAYCLAVHNRADVTGEYRLTTDELAGSPDPDQQVEVKVTPVALGSWIRPLAREVTLEPGERAFIPYTITTPASIPRGTLTARLVVTRTVAADPAAAPPPATLQVSASHRIHLTMPGGERSRLDVRDVRSPRLLWHGSGPLAYRARFVVVNPGTVLDVQRSRLEVEGFGRRVAKVENRDAAVLPQGAQRVTLAWQDLPWIGWYQPKVTVHARAGDTVVELPSVLVLPGWPYLLAIAVALALPFLVLAARHRRRRREWRAWALAQEDGEQDEHDGHDGDDDAFEDGDGRGG